ncbi:Rz-like lysis system protein LysB [Escherichia marmotae]
MFAAMLHAKKVLSLQPDCVRLDVYRTAAVLEQNQGIQRANAFLISFCKKALPRLELVAKKYECAGINSKVSTSVFGSHFDTQLMQYLASRMVNMVARYNRLPDMSRADVDLLAADIANFIRGELANINDHGFGELKTLYTWYNRAGFISLQFNVIPPHWDRVAKKYVGADEIAPAIAKMFNDGWWRGRLRRVAATWREHLQIAVGNVSKKKNTYASKNCVTDWREQKRRTREFLKGLDLEDEDGNRISLIEKYDGSVANPAIRRCELMTRIRGFENICNELGYVGEFYTLTAPSKYHATTKAGYRNSKWSGASPADTQNYLTDIWARIRAKLHREDVRIFGIRVAEPHHDGTPHWHMLMFMLPEDVEYVRSIVRKYAWKEDRRELKSDKAKKARFHAESIDPEKGSATGYVAKYISKNIDGYALDGETDDESGELLKETAPAVSAWASRWHIRQFQFIGGAPVTVYRELRRLADTETAHGLSVEFAAVHDAADAGDWAGYVNAQGGPFVRRDDLQVRTLYEPRTELNQYGEETVCIKGVYDSSIGAGSPILTRLTQWKIVPKHAVDLAVDLQDGKAVPRSSQTGHCVAHGWRGDGMKILITLLVLAVLGLLWLRHENGNLSRSFETANRVASEQKTTIGMLKNQLSVAGQLARRNESAQVELREQLAKASAEASRREQTITRLLNENEAFRRWYNAALPDVVRRLHTRTACASAGDCGQRMPEGEPLSDAGK